MKKDDVVNLVHAVLDSELDRLKRETIRNLSGSTKEAVNDWKGDLGSVGYKCATASYSSEVVEFGVNMIIDATNNAAQNHVNVNGMIVDALGAVNREALLYPLDPSPRCYTESAAEQIDADKLRVLELAMAIVEARGMAYTVAYGDLSFSDAMRDRAHTDLDDFHRRPAVDALVPVVSQPAGDVSVLQPALTIGEAIEKRLAETAGKGTAKTADERSAKLRLFAEAIDTTKTLSDLSADMVLDFADLLRFLPARRADKYRDVPVLEFRSRASHIGVSASAILALKTQINILAMLRAFVNWLPKRGHITFDHAKGLSLTISELMGGLHKAYKKAGGSSRTSFSTVELQMLFTPGWYVAETDKYPERFWLPILALHTGGRTQDLLTLRRRDIKVTPDNPDIFHIKDGSIDEDTSRDGIPYIDLTDAMEKELKTPRANRVIPVHPYVWNELGFSRFIQSFKPEEFLFGNHIMENRELSNAFGAWFTRFRRGAGVGRQENDKVSRDVVFHGFRHTVKRALRLKRCDTSIVHEVIGHDDNSETNTSKTYSGEFLIEQKLDEVIAKLDFHNSLPLIDLAGSKWTIADRQRTRRRKKAHLSKV